MIATASLACVLLRLRRLLQDFHLAINAQYLGHFCRKVGVAAFQVVAHFVRFNVLLVEDFAHRALREMGETGMSCGPARSRAWRGEQPRRPQFVRIAKILGLATGQINQHALASIGDGRLAAATRAIVKSRHRALRHCALDATLHGLVMQIRASGLPQKTKGLPDTPAGFAPARPGPPVGFATARSISTSPYPHISAKIQSLAATLPSFNPVLVDPRSPIWESERPDESPDMTAFKELLVRRMKRSNTPGW